MTAIVPVVLVPVSMATQAANAGAVNAVGTNVVTSGQLISGQLATMLQGQFDNNLFQNVLENVNQVTTGHSENAENILANLSSNILVQNTSELQNLSNPDILLNLENLDIGLMPEMVVNLENINIEEQVKEVSLLDKLTEIVELALPEEEIDLEISNNATPQLVDINKIFEFENNNIKIEDTAKIMQQTFNEVKPELSDQIFNNLPDDMKRMVVKENGNVKIATVLQSTESSSIVGTVSEFANNMAEQQSASSNLDQNDVMQNLNDARTKLDEVVAEKEEDTTGNFVSQLLENQNKSMSKSESKKNELDKIDEQNKILAHNAAMKYRDAQGLSVTDQIKIQIKQAIDSGDSQIKIKLHPSELGSLNIQLDLSKINGNQISIAADKLSTLNLLQNDMKNLQRSLAEVGVRTDDLNLTMNFSNQNNSDQQQRFDQQELYKNYSFNINKEIAELDNIVATHNNIMYNSEYNGLGINIMA